MVNRIQLEPEAQAFEEAVAKPPFLFDLGPEKGRAALDQLQSGPASNLPPDVEDLTIEGGPVGEVSVRILKPENSPLALPVIVYIHGAGWVFGNKHTHHQLVRELAWEPGLRWSSLITASPPKPGTLRLSKKATH
jgi:acetyl esterase